MASVKKQASLRHKVTSIDPENDDERTKICKTITWILRDGLRALQGKRKPPVKMDADGWVNIDDLAKADLLEGIDKDTMMHIIVDFNGKKLRYELRGNPTDGEFIRAYKKAERKEKDAVDYSVPSFSYHPKADEKKGDGKMSAASHEFVPGQTPSTPASSSAGGYPFGLPGYGYTPMMPWMNPWMAAGLAGKYVGRVKSFNPEKGFGFIECPQTWQLHQRDVFLHKAQIGDMAVGQYVTFSCEVNKQNMPQAKDVQQMGAGMQAPGKGKSKGKGKGKDKSEKTGEKGKPKGDGKGKQNKDKHDTESNDKDVKVADEAPKDVTEKEEKNEEAPEA